MESFWAILGLILFSKKERGGVEDHTATEQNKNYWALKSKVFNVELGCISMSL